MKLLLCLLGGLIMDVVNAEQAKIAEEAGDVNSRRKLFMKLEW